MSFCYTPLTRGAPTAISPDTVSLLSRAFDPTSVSKVGVWCSSNLHENPVLKERMLFI